MEYEQKGIHINGITYKTTTHELKDNGSGIRLSLAKSVYQPKQTIEIMHEDDFMELKKQVEHYGHQKDKLQIKELTEQVANQGSAIATLQQELQQTIQEKDTIIDELKAELKEYENKCIGFEETIANCESDIHQKDNIILELTPYKDYIKPKQHYDELTALKDTFAVEKERLQQQIADKDNELNELESNVATQLATKEKELTIAFADEKSALLVAYNNNINHYKIKYNNLANKYNALSGDVSKLNRFNTMFNGRHNEIKKEHEVVELEVVKKDNTQNTTINLNEGLQN